jgi:pimeloyl-ACP methyl ester carboxylesterase
MTDGTAIFCTAATNRPWQPAGPTLLGLHGGPGIDGSQMRYFLQPAQEWSTVVVPDQRGHGRSDHSSPDSWTLDRWAEDARELIHALGLEDIVLVGTSFGGFVAQHFMSTYPGVARGAVIVGSSPRRASVDEIVARYAEVGGPEAARVMRRTMTEPGPEVEEEWARVCGPLSRLRPPDDTLAQIQRKRVNTPEVNARFMDTLNELDLRPGLAAVTDPMLVLVGEKDPLTPPGVATEIRDHASGADVTVHVVAAASHQVLWDQPAQAFDLVREFAHRVTGHADCLA